MTHIMPTYNRQPVSFTRGQGSWVYTKDDTPYLDALTGIAVCGLGHAHPAITKAIQQQSEPYYTPVTCIKLIGKNKLPISSAMPAVWIAYFLQIVVQKQTSVP